MSNDEINQRKRATSDLNAIEDLKKNPAFTGYFQRRVNEEVEKRREKILTDRGLSAEQLYQERLLYFAVLDTSTLMDQDERACRSTLGPNAD